MRTWQRTVANTKCGNCPAVIPKDAPVQVVTLPGVKRVSFRCSACASEPVGEVLSMKPDSGGWTQIGRPRLTKVLPFDFKMAQGGLDD